MRKIIYIVFFLLSYTAYSQSLSISNVDAGGFPNVKANFFAFDLKGSQLTNLLPNDFELTENGQPRKITFVSCPEIKPPIIISSVLVMDVSGSMSGKGLDIAKAAANVWVDMLPAGNSECAITSFSDANYLNQDFTVDKSKLKNGINSLTCMQGTNYNAAMLDAMSGGILVANRGKYKRVILLLSDGEPNFEPDTAKIISTAIANDITIYCIAIRMSAPQCMKEFSNKTGGLFFENIRTNEEAEGCYREILITAQGGDPCQIGWESGISCESGITDVALKLIANNTTANASYQSPNSAIAQLEFDPMSIKLLKTIPGIPKDSSITIKAVNADFNITDVISSNPAFTMNPTSFILNAGQSKVLTISYLPVDSGYTYTKFTFENDICPTKYYASGGFPGKKPKTQTLKLISPNGGEVFAVGSDTVITWEGIMSDEEVQLEYSTNNGLNWLQISDTAKGLIHKWRVPKTPSNKCLARVTAKTSSIYDCQNSEIRICSQIWMGCNLNVDHYRNGDPIPEVQDPTDWINLKTGAWCYYNNDPGMEAKYGKLYNWYAVHDPRGLAPQGWHISSDTDWRDLEFCLGGVTIAGAKLKSTGSIENGDGLWYNPNTEATDEFGFSALPGGYRFAYGAFDNLGSSGYWWSSSEYDKANAWLRGMSYTTTSVTRSYSKKENGFSVRCIKD
ncbi:MAG: FISUMP domain-containing protein [bacterium]